MFGLGWIFHKMHASTIVGQLLNFFCKSQQKQELFLAVCLFFML